MRSEEEAERSTTSLEIKLSTEFDLSPSYNGKAHKSILGWDSIPAQEQLSPSGVQGNVRQWWIKQTHLSSPLLAGQKSQVGFILPYFSVAFSPFSFLFCPISLSISICVFLLSVVTRSLFLSLLAELTAWSIDSSQSMLSSWESPSLVTQNKDIRNKRHTRSLSLSSLLVTSDLAYKSGGDDGPLPDTEYQCWQRAVLWEGCNNITEHTSHIQTTTMKCPHARLVLLLSLSIFLFYFDFDVMEVTIDFIFWLWNSKQHKTTVKHPQREIPRRVSETNIYRE